MSETDAAAFTIAEQTIASEFERFTDVQREQARVAGQLLAPGMTLKQHFAPDTATFRELEVWRVERSDGSGAHDVWLCSLPRGVVFEAGTTQLVTELTDSGIDRGNEQMRVLARAAAVHTAAGRQLFGRWARRVLVLDEPEEAPGQPATVPLAAGTFVYVKWRQRWCAASIVSSAGDHYRVHYDGWESSFDEYVTLARLRMADERCDVAVGAGVNVELRGSFCPARVVALQPDGRVRVRYEGSPTGLEEDVVPARIRD